MEVILGDHGGDIGRYGGEEVVDEDAHGLQGGHGGGVVNLQTVQIVTPHFGGGRGITGGESGR